MGTMTKEMVEQLKNLTKDTTNAVFGICTFCEKPIMAEQVERGITDFTAVVQRLFVHFDDKHITKALRALFACRECSGSLFKISIMKQLSEIHIDLKRVNEDFAKALKEHAIKEEAQKLVEEKLKEVKQDEKTETPT